MKPTSTGIRITIAAVCTIAAAAAGAELATTAGSTDIAVTQHCPPAAAGPTANGTAVIATGLDMGIDQHGITTALTAALTETRLQIVANPNVPASLTIPHDALASDHLGVGILLQQPPGWGPTATLMTAGGAAHAFYVAMRTVPDWQTSPPARLAQLVQRAITPDPYAAEIPAAAAFYRAHVNDAEAARASGCTATAGSRP
ncbi:MAG: hypothetical protein J0H22_13770 [Actinobacteria bacterium]|nr:hypothetical protein [Actinomycetota bacterium]